MALPSIAGTVRATFRGSNAAGQQWANVMHFRYATGASNPGPVEIAALDARVLRLYIGTAYPSGAGWLTFCTPQIALIDATYYVLNGTSSPVQISHTQTGTAATNTNTAQENAHVLTLRTGIRGRRYRGRIYLPAVSTASMSGTGGVLVAGTVASALAQARGLLADLPSIQWEWGVASYGAGTNHGMPQVWTPFFTPLADVTMDAIPDVQRRRKQ